MLHNDIKRLAQEIGNELQDAADDANVLVTAVESAESYPEPEDWIDRVEGETEELVATLDLLVSKCAAVRDALDVARRGVSA